MVCNEKLYDNVTNIIISATVLFSALAWRDAAISYVDNHPEVKGKGPWAYAAFVTVLALLVIVVLMFPLKNLACK